MADPSTERTEEKPYSGSEGSDPAGRAPVSVLPVGSKLFINRELSWLEFNQRVLDEATDPAVPVLERHKFIAISAANLDEFFMVRVAGLVEQVAGSVEEVPADGMTPAEQLSAIATRTQEMVAEMYRVVREQLFPELASFGVRLIHPEDLNEDGHEFLAEYFRKQVLPILTPLAIDPGHPFPHVRNKSLNLIAMLSSPGRDHEDAFAVVQVPSVLPRLVQVPSSKEGESLFVSLEDIIASHVTDLFPGFRCSGAWSFRVIRNFDLEIDEEDAEDLLESVREEVRRRDRGRAVRLTVEAGAAGAAVELLEQALQVDRPFVFHVEGPLALQELTGMAEPLTGRRELKDEPFEPVVPGFLRDADDLFEVVRRQDILLHHPYESFDPVVAFVEAAASDPDVLAIKQTVYRTSGDSPIVKALIRAAENRKQVTALVEIKARFDEENNIQWAHALEHAGVHVVYGLLGLKTHAKASLVVRREGAELRRYVHYGTGNYNPHTARLYTDLSLLTSAPELGEDATSLFNLLTSCTAPAEWKKITVAPLGLHERVLGFIERESTYARAGRKAAIVAKMNSLADPDVIQALYRASQAGVQIDLIVRGICCLRPQLPGVSDNIRVRSIVDRFLEHARIFYFEAGGAREVYASSADWMPRNFQRRVEVMFPIESEHLKARVFDEILRLQLEDNVKASELDAMGRYHRPARSPGAPPACRSQEGFLGLARRSAADAGVQLDRPFIVRPVRNRPTKPEPGTSGGGPS